MSGRVLNNEENAYGTTNLLYNVKQPMTDELESNERTYTRTDRKNTRNTKGELSGTINNSAIARSIYRISTAVYLCREL